MESKNAITISLCQVTPVPGSTETNVCTIIEHMERASESGAKLAIFGELILQGCDLHSCMEAAEPQTGPSSQVLSEVASRLGLAIIYGYAEADGGAVYNSVMFLDSQGEQVGHYRKAHLDPANESSFSTGDALVVVDWLGGVKVALAVHEDICIADYIRAQVCNGGAQLIVVLASLPREAADDERKLAELVAPTRAFENRCFVAVCDVATDHHLGLSRVYDAHGTVVTAATEPGAARLLTVKIPLNTHHGVTKHFLPLRRPALYADGAIDYNEERPWTRGQSSSVEHYFEHRARFYDSQMDGSYNGPTYSAAELARLLPDQGASILDVAAGTGLVGEALARFGFNNIVAADRSAAMLEELMRKGVYKEQICGAFEEEAPKMQDGSFQACTCVGAFLTGGFLDPQISVMEMVRLVKAGGFVLLMWNAYELSLPECVGVRDSLEATIDEVVSKGKCEIVLRKVMPKYIKDCDGTLLIFNKL